MDENIPEVIGRLLRAQGRDALWVAKSAPWATDEDVLAMARAEGRELVSFDRDYGDMIFGRGAAAPRAVVLFRMARPQLEHAEILARVLATIGTDVLDGCFTVIALGGMRQRSLPTVP